MFLQMKKKKTKQKPSIFATAFPSFPSQQQMDRLLFHILTGWIEIGEFFADVARLFASSNQTKKKKSSYSFLAHSLLSVFVAIIYLCQLFLCVLFSVNHSLFSVQYKIIQNDIAANFHRSLYFRIRG
ncbi:unnamed protein product [Umbelopsis ramanniana]